MSKNKIKSIHVQLLVKTCSVRYHVMSHVCIDFKVGSASGGQFAFPALECVYRDSWTPEVAPGAAGTRRHTSFPQMSDLGQRRLTGPPR